MVGVIGIDPLPFGRVDGEFAAVIDKNAVMFGVHLQQVMFAGSDRSAEAVRGADEGFDTSNDDRVVGIETMQGGSEADFLSRRDNVAEVGGAGVFDEGCGKRGADGFVANMGVLTGAVEVGKVGHQRTPALRQGVRALLCRPRDSKTRESDRERATTALGIDGYGGSCKLFALKPTDT